MKIFCPAVGGQELVSPADTFRSDPECRKLVIESEHFRAASPTSPIRPAAPEFSSCKSLSGKGCRGPNTQKSAVVPTKSILKAANVPIIGGHHVLALQSSPEGWQATPLLERCREHAGRRRARGAAARAVPGRDQRHAGIGVAAVDRGDRGRRRATSHAVAVSGGPL